MLWLTINLILTLHSLIQVPLCYLPSLIRPTFCTHGIAPFNNTSHHSLKSRFICWVPGISSTAICGGATPDHGQLSLAVEDEFRHLSSLHDSTFAADGLISEIGSAVEAIRDLIILVRNSNIKNKAAIIKLLEAIIESGYVSRESLTAYVARVSASMTAIVGSASHTMDIIQSDESSLGFIFNQLCQFGAMFYTCTTPAQVHFLHTIKTIENFITTLQHYNSLTDQSVLHLEHHIHGIIDLVGDENYETEAEFGELLQRLWTRLGGNRSLLADISGRLKALSSVGTHAREMRSIVAYIRQDLDQLKKSTDALRVMATEPLLIEGPTPRSIIVRQLSQGCKALEYSLQMYGLGVRRQQSQKLHLGF